MDPSGKCKHHHGPEMDEWWDSRRKPTTTVAPTRRGGFKQRISAQADDVWDDIESTLHAAIEQATKKQFAKCPHCKKRHEIDVRDWPASLRASEMLLDRVAPKPSTAAGKQAVDGDDFTDMTMERIAAMSYEELRAYRAFTLASDSDAIARALDDLDAFDELRAEFGSSGIAEGALRTRARLDDEDMRALYERLYERYGGPREIVA